MTSMLSNLFSTLKVYISQKKNNRHGNNHIIAAIIRRLSETAFHFQPKASWHTFSLNKQSNFKNRSIIRLKRALITCPVFILFTPLVSIAQAPALSENGDPYKLIGWAVVILLVTVMIISIITLVLVTYNRQLRKSVQKQTLELSLTNNTLLNEINEHRQTEKHIKENEERFSSIIENLSDIIWVFDREMKIKFATSSCERTLGYSSESLIGTNGQDLVYPEDIETIKQAFEKALIGPDPSIPTEFRLIHMNGSIVPMEAIANNMLDHPGIQGIIVTSRDISERKRSQKILREKEQSKLELTEHLAILIEVSLELSRALSCDELCRQAVLDIREKLGFDRIGIWFIDENDPEYERGSYGTDEQGQLRDERNERHPIKMYKGAADLIENRIKQVYQQDAVLVNPANENVGHGPHVVTAIWDGRKVIGFLNSDNLITGNPITENSRELLKLYANTLGHLCTRKRAEETLHYRNAFIELISEISTRFINISIEAIDESIEESLKEICDFTGAEGGYVYALSEDFSTIEISHYWQSDAIKFERAKNVESDITQMKWWLSRISEKGIVEIPSIDTIPPAAEFEKYLATISGSKSSIDIPMIYQDKVIGALSFISARDIRFWTEDEVSLLKLVSGSITNALQRKVAEKESEKLKNQLSQAQKMEAVGQLAGGIAHDFNNLLQAIQGYTDLCLEELDHDSMEAENLREVINSVERASTLVQQLLTFSRRKMLNSVYLNFNDVIAGLMKMVSRLIGEHIELNVIPGHDLKTTYADPGQIEQILINLCVNARDAMPDGGRITIETNNVNLDEVFCSENPWAKRGSYVSIEISDTGMGISPEIREHIFEPFFTTKGVGEGTGLGLATVYGVIKQHDGLINVTSESGKGTKFILYFPATMMKSEHRDEQEPDYLSTNGHETVLLAEDEDLVRGLMLRILEKSGYSVIQANDGNMAIEKFKKNQDKIDIAVLDVIMPYKNGRDVFEYVRSINPKLPVLFCTGYSRDYLGTKYEPWENTDLIQKPIGQEDMLRKIRQLFRKANRREKISDM